MQIRKVKLTKEEAQRLKDMDNRKLYNFVEDIAVREGFHPAGYGFQNPKKIKENGNVYVTWECYESCD